MTLADIEPLVEPLYFYIGFACGLLFINLFKGRWFV